MQRFALSSPVRLVLAVVATASAACSKSEDPTPPSPGTDPATAGTTNPGGQAPGVETPGTSAPGMVGAPTACAKSQIEILFSPMYSAHDGVHRFQVPATVNGVDPGAITWSISDPTLADLQPSADGVMITVQKAGSATIIASAGTLCGTASLQVSPATADDWMVGSARYSTGEVLQVGMGPRLGGGGGGGDAGVASREVACTSCHGDTATNGPFKTVSHTPMQTAGFSDAELIGIFTMGVLPDGAYFDDEIVPRQQWSRFHRWTMTEAQAKAMVVYLRSLTPESQKGERADFGGRRMRPDGGFGRGDGGRGGGDARNPPDAAATD